MGFNLKTAIAKAIGAVPRAEMEGLVRSALREERRATALHARSFAAAKLTNLTDQWTVQDEHINLSLYRQLRILRARSRDMVQNSDHGRRFVSLCKTNVVGPNGVSLQVHALKDNGEIDVLDSDRLEGAFAAWGKRGTCDVTGKLSWVDAQNIFVAHLVRDGEVLVRKVLGRGRFGFQLQFLDPGLLNEEYNVDLANGNKIRMGVELDVWGAPVAYHVYSNDPNDITRGYRGYQYVRIPAGEIIHAFLAEFSDQIRGCPPMATPMFRMRQLADFNDAALTAAKEGASRLGFFVSPDGEAPATLVDDQTSDGTQITTTQPGTYDTLPQGYDFKANESEYPHGNYESFVKACLHSMAAGLNVSYHSLASDLEGVNYTSSRTGELHDRDVWQALQNFVVDVFCAPVYSTWLAPALLSGQEGLDALPFRKLAKFDAATWQPRRWQWVDPEKEMNANAAAIRLGLKTPSQVIREQGGDPETLWREYAADKARLAELGIDPTQASTTLKSTGDTGNAASSSNAQI